MEILLVLFGIGIGAGIALTRDPIQVHDRYTENDIVDPYRAGAK